MGNREHLRLSSMVYGPGGNDRLCLFYVPVGEDGLDFHSVVWERHDNGYWGAFHELSKDDFQWNHPRRRWVADLHSISPKNGCAVLQIAEGNKPMIPPSSTTFLYSWRLWDLLNNTEVKRLKDCESPFDGYDPTGR